MFHSSTIHHFDTMFVILCVIAGATSHTISNTSRTIPNYRLHNRYKSSFIELLIDNSLSEYLKSSNAVKKDLDNNLVEYFKSPEAVKSNQQTAQVGEQARTLDFQLPIVENARESRDFCAQLSNILSGSQIKFCHKHYHILEAILPQVLQLAKEECARVTQDLRWNCTAIDLFLDRSNALCRYQFCHNILNSDFDDIFSV